MTRPYLLDEPSKPHPFIRLSEAATYCPFPCGKHYSDRIHQDQGEFVVTLANGSKGATDEQRR